MGMFDRDDNFEENYRVGDVFTLVSLEYVGKIRTKYGEAEQSLAKILVDGEPKTFSLLGIGFAGQARRAEPSDFPREVKYIREPTGDGSNEVKLFAPVNS